MSDRSDFPPKQPGDLTPEWLTDRLRESGAIGADDRITGWSTTLLGEGAGMLGVVARLGLEYEDGSGPLDSVVAKFATPTEGNRAVAMAFRMYEREVRFFGELVGRVDTGIPRCHAGRIDVDTGDFHLILEDLVGYREGDQAAGCDADDARTCIDTIAPLHAAWWGARDQPELAWVPRSSGDLYRGGMVPAAQASYEPFVSNFGDVLPDEVASAGERYLAALDDLHVRMGEGPQTLCHGDFRLDNLLFGTRPDQPPLMLIDWQGVIVSKGTQDLAYLLSQNLRTEERRDHERELVEHYHGRLAEHGVEGYPLDDCWEDYRLSALWLYQYGIVIGGSLDPANERGRAFMAALISRSAATIVDLDLLELLAADGR